MSSKWGASGGGPNPPVALSIAGSDSGAGAGIQVDLKTFSAHRVFGTTAITAITAQNTIGVQGIEVVPAQFVDTQIASVLADLPVGAVKTGMLATAATVVAVAARARRGELPNLVVDPVMVSSSGTRLLDVDAEAAYIDLLVPEALVLTPNLREASILTGMHLSDVDSMIKAARFLCDTGARFVVVKGGHSHGDQVTDVFCDGQEVVLLTVERVETYNVHGTGCTLSAAIAANLAKGAGVKDAVSASKDYVAGALRGAAAWNLGAGHGPLDHFGWVGNHP